MGDIEITKLFTDCNSQYDFTFSSYYFILIGNKKTIFIKPLAKLDSNITLNEVWQKSSKTSNTLSDLTKLCCCS